MPEPTLSVVIAVCSSGNALEAILATLDEEPCHDRVECIVVEDGADATSQLPRASWHLPVTLLRNHASVGCSFSRNRGWKAARGRYVVFLDEDMIPTPGWLGAYLEVIDRCQPDLAPGTPCGRDSYPTCSGAVDARTSASPFSASNVAIAREVLAAAGGFPPFLGGSRDIELGIRLAELRPRVAAARNARVRGLDAAASPYFGWTDAERRAFLWRNPVHAAFTLPIWGRDGNGTAAESVLWADAPGAFVCSADWIAKYLGETAGVSLSAAHEYLQRALTGGVIAKELDEGRTHFDTFHTLNWLRSRTRFLEDELKNSTFARTHPTPRRSQRADAKPVDIHCRGQYAMELDLTRDLSWETTVLNVALPVERLWQRNVRVTRLIPSSLSGYLDEAGGLIAKVPGALCQAAGGVIGYEFECDIAEAGTCPETRSRADGWQLRCLRLTFPPACRERTAALLDHILEGARQAPEDDVRRIYRWILENLAYAPTDLPDWSVLETGIGSCVHLTRLFVNLVRLRGVPARELSGALMASETGRSQVVTFGLGYSLFSHTWAEVYLNGAWRPVEFLAICYSKWRANAFNVGPELRSEMAAHTEPLMDYYFGNADPYRIYAADGINRIPPVMSAGTAPTSYQPGERIAHVHHRLVCEIS